MLEAHVSAMHPVAQRLQKLAQLYQQGQVTMLMDRTLQKLMRYEADACRVHLAQLQKDMAVFEQQYALSSVEFYRRFRSGQTDDRMDYVEWASLMQMADNLRERLRLLSGES